MANGRSITVLPHGTLAELTRLAHGVSESDRRARANHGDPRDYTFNPNPPKPSEIPTKCPVCNSKHQFVMVKQHASREKHWHCGRCGNNFSVDKDGIFSKWGMQNF